MRDTGTPRPGEEQRRRPVLARTAWGRGAGAQGAGVRCGGPAGGRAGRAAAEPALRERRPTSPGKWLVCVGSMAAGVREAQGRGCLSLASVAFREGFALSRLPSGAGFVLLFFKNWGNVVLQEVVFA